MRNNSEQRRSARGCQFCNNANARSINRGRRSFISGIAATGLGTLVGSGAGQLMPVFAQTPVASKDSLIDVHHHIVPPFLSL
jgi:hypothetical protein